MIDTERRTALLLRQSLASLAREAQRRRTEAQCRPENSEAWWRGQVDYIRQWVRASNG